MVKKNNGEIHPQKSPIMQIRSYIIRLDLSKYRNDK